jgi:hypothetical protein
LLFEITQLENNKMSENLPQPERLEAGGQHEISAHSFEPAGPEELTKASAEQQTNRVEAEAIVAEEAPTKNVLEAFQEAEAARAEPVSTLISTEARQADKNRQVKRIQRQLKPADKVLSKVIHQPVVRAVSEVAAKTVSRPSGLLGGGIVAFLGSAAYLYFTKYIGLPYNYFLFTLLFVGGFVIGLSLELIVWSLTSYRRRAE